MAAVPLNFIWLSMAVVLKLDPVMVTRVPGSTPAGAFPEAGEKEVITGAGVGSTSFLQDVSNNTERIRLQVPITESCGSLGLQLIDLLLFIVYEILDCKLI